MDVWVQREVAGCEFPDQRLKTRLGKLMTDLGNKVGATIPTASQDWAATKAAYRFFDNPRVDESMILSGHFEATRSRIARTPETILVLHDTTEFSFQRDRPEEIGVTTILPSCRLGQQPVTKCGLLMHSCLTASPPVFVSRLWICRLTNVLWRSGTSISTQGHTYASLCHMEAFIHDAPPELAHRRSAVGRM